MSIEDVAKQTIANMSPENRDAMRLMHVPSIKSFAERAAFALTLGIEHFIKDTKPTGPCVCFLRKPVAGKLAVVVVDIIPVIGGATFHITRNKVGK